MKTSIFGAIEVESYEVSLKIIEISVKNGIRTVDFIRKRIEIGKDVYNYGKADPVLINELCNTLKEFKAIMDSYKVEDYRACSTSVFRKNKNADIIIDYIKLKTGICIEILSNSEQRFIGYKSIASNENDFHNIILKPTAIVDISGGSMQFSLFDKDKLIITQNIRLGTLRLRDKLANIKDNASNFLKLTEELLNKEMDGLKKFYLTNREIRNLIVLADNVSMVKQKLINNNTGNMLSKEVFLRLCNKIYKNDINNIEDEMDIPSDNVTLLMPEVIICKRMIEETGAETIYIPGVDLSDGLAYEYAERNKLIKIKHDFDNDIIAASRNMAKRYMCNKEHIDVTEKIAMEIFDSLKKEHGLGKREKLLLRIAVILHECGEYISLAYASESSYHIIMSTEIMGLSNRERNCVANIIKYRKLPFEDFEEIHDDIALPQYLLIAKLTAILKLAVSLDQSHRQKIKSIKSVVKSQKLIISVESENDIYLEKTSFENKIRFFEEIFGLKPELNKKNKILLY